MGASLVIARGLLLLGCKAPLWAFPRSATHLLEGFHISFKLTRDLFPTFNINSYLTGSHWFCQILLPFTSMWGSVVAVLGLSCMRDLSSLDRGSNPHTLHRKVDSQPLDHQGGPCSFSFNVHVWVWSLSMFAEHEIEYLLRKLMFLPLPSMVLRKHSTICLFPQVFYWNLTSVTYVWTWALELVLSFGLNILWS